MKERLPAVRPFASTLEQAPLLENPKQKVSDSLAYLAGQTNALATFGSADELGVVAYEDPSSAAARYAWHIFQIRVVLSSALQTRGIFIGWTVLDELFLDELRKGTPRPLLGVLERIRDARMTRPGLMIFPLHSFGILAAGLVHAYTDQRISVMSPSWGVALSPQTNSFERTLAFLERSRLEFGVQQRLPEDLLKHWLDSRPTEWLEANPLLVVRTINVPGYYYDNEPLLLARLRAVTSLMAMLAALQPDEASRSETLFSSRQLNNWQTLDIHHYIVLYNTYRRGGELTGDCVPIHAARTAVVDASELNIDLDARFWSRRRERTANTVRDAVENVYTGYLAHGRNYHVHDARARVYRKLFDALGYYKQSFSRSDDDWRATVSLATAWEMMLTDRYATGVTARLERRTKLLLKGVTGTTKYQQAVRDTYSARSEIVHEGALQTQADLHAARAAYVHCFVEIVRRMSNLNPSSTTPLSDLIGDHR